MPQGFRNVFETFKSIGSNIVRGRIFTGVPVSQKFRGTLVGKFAQFITKPAAIFGVPAAIAGGVSAAPAVAARLTAIRAAAAVRTASAARIAVRGAQGVGRVVARGARSLPKVRIGTLTRLGLGTAAVGGAFKLADVIPKLIESRGAGGLITGTGEIDPFRRVPPGQSRTFESDGSFITVTPDGSIISQPSDASGAIPGTFDPAFLSLGQQRETPFTQGVKAILPLVLIAGGVFVVDKLTKKRS